METTRTTRKKDNAPRGVFRHASGLWAIRFTCGAGHIHEERASSIKTEAIRAHQDRRRRALGEPGWCPAIERADVRSKTAAAVTFRAHAADYEAWARGEHRSFRNTQCELRRLTATFGDRPLAAVTSGDVERFLRGLREGDGAVSPATCNRYRDRISGIYRRAIRLGLVQHNPAHGIRKAKEAGGRVVYLTADDEAAIRDQLAPALRPLFAFSLHTGLRWSEQAALRWCDVDMLAGVVTVARSKNGHSRRVPMDSLVASLLVDLGASRGPQDASDGLVFGGVAYRTVCRAFTNAVTRASAALRDAGKDASRLDGYTWHGNRHTFASRLVMAGVDLRAVQELGGWKTLKMVQRYGHLSPDHLRAAVERLVTTPSSVDGEVSATGNAAVAPAAVELQRNFDTPTVVQTGCIVTP